MIKSKALYFLYVIFCLHFFSLNVYATQSQNQLVQQIFEKRKQLAEKAVLLFEKVNQEYIDEGLEEDDLLIRACISFQEIMDEVSEIENPIEKAKLILNWQRQYPLEVILKQLSKRRTDYYLRLSQILNEYYAIKEEFITFIQKVFPRYAPIGTAIMAEEFGISTVINPITRHAISISTQALVEKVSSKNHLNNLEQVGWRVVDWVDNQEKTIYFEAISEEDLENLSHYYYYPDVFWIKNQERIIYFPTIHPGIQQLNPDSLQLRNIIVDDELKTVYFHTNPDEIHDDLSLRNIVQDSNFYNRQLYDISEPQSYYENPERLLDPLITDVVDTEYLPATITQHDQRSSTTNDSYYLKVSKVYRVYYGTKDVYIEDGKYTSDGQFLGSRLVQDAFTQWILINFNGKWDSNGFFSGSIYQTDLDGNGLQNSSPFTHIHHFYDENLSIIGREITRGEVEITEIFLEGTDLWEHRITTSEGQLLRKETRKFGNDKFVFAIEDEIFNPQASKSNVIYHEYNQETKELSSILISNKNVEGIITSSTQYLGTFNHNILVNGTITDTNSDQMILQIQVKPIFNEDDFIVGRSLKNTEDNVTTEESFDWTNDQMIYQKIYQGSEETSNHRKNIISISINPNYFDKVDYGKFSFDGQLVKRWLNSSSGKMLKRYGSKVMSVIVYIDENDSTMDKIIFNYQRADRIDKEKFDTVHLYRAYDLLFINDETKKREFFKSISYIGQDVSGLEVNEISYHSVDGELIVNFQEQDLYNNSKVFNKEYIYLNPEDGTQISIEREETPAKREPDSGIGGYGYSVENLLTSCENNGYFGKLLEYLSLDKYLDIDKYLYFVDPPIVAFKEMGEGAIKLVAGSQESQIGFYFGSDEMRLQGIRHTIQALTVDSRHLKDSVVVSLLPSLEDSEVAGQLLSSLFRNYFDSESRDQVLHYLRLEYLSFWLSNGLHGLPDKDKDHYYQIFNGKKLESGEDLLKDPGFQGWFLFEGFDQRNRAKFVNTVPAGRMFWITHKVFYGIGEAVAGGAGLRMPFKSASKFMIRNASKNSFLIGAASDSWFTQVSAEILGGRVSPFRLVGSWTSSKNAARLSAQLGGKVKDPIIRKMIVTPSMRIFAKRQILTEILHAPVSVTMGTHVLGGLSLNFIKMFETHPWIIDHKEGDNREKHFRAIENMVEELGVLIGLGLSSHVGRPRDQKATNNQSIRPRLNSGLSVREVLGHLLKPVAEGISRRVVEKNTLNDSLNLARLAGASFRYEIGAKGLQKVKIVDRFPQEIRQFVSELYRKSFKEVEGEQVEVGCWEIGLKQDGTVLRGDLVTSKLSDQIAARDFVSSLEKLLEQVDPKMIDSIAFYHTHPDRTTISPLSSSDAFAFIGDFGLRSLLESRGIFVPIDLYAVQKSMGPLERLVTYHMHFPTSTIRWVLWQLRDRYSFLGQNSNLFAPMYGRRLPGGFEQRPPIKATNGLSKRSDAEITEFAQKLDHWVANFEYNEAIRKIEDFFEGYKNPFKKQLNTLGAMEGRFEVFANNLNDWSPTPFKESGIIMDTNVVILISETIKNGASAKSYEIKAAKAVLRYLKIKKELSNLGHESLGSLHKFEREGLIKKVEDEINVFSTDQLKNELEAIFSNIWLPDHAIFELSGFEGEAIYKNVNRLALESNRTSDSYNNLLRQLFTTQVFVTPRKKVEVRLGKYKGSMDRVIVTDVFFADKESDFIQTFMVHDRDVVTSLLRIKSPNVSSQKLYPGKGKGEIFKKYPEGFIIELKDDAGNAYKIRVVPVVKKQKGTNINYYAVTISGPSNLT